MHALQCIMTYCEIRNIVEIIQLNHSERFCFSIKGYIKLEIVVLAQFQGTVSVLDNIESADHSLATNSL